MNGAVPVNAVAMIVPLFTVGHDVAVLIALPVLPVPAATVSINKTLQPILSVIVTV